MLIIRGVNVFPSQIEQLLLEMMGLAPHYLILVDRQKDQLDELEVWVEAREGIYRRGDAAVGELQRRVQEELQQSLGIHLRVRVVGPREIQRSEGKAIRVVDRREV